jgi:hypothetical protein
MQRQERRYYLKDAAAQAHRRHELVHGHALHELAVDVCINEDDEHLHEPPRLPFHSPPALRRGHGRELVVGRALFPHDVRQSSRS